MTSTFPLRHPETPRPVPGLRPFALLLGVRRPGPHDWDQLGRALVVGDPPMDALVDWMYTEGLRDTRPLFEQALHAGVDSVEAAPGPLREFFRTVETDPPWLDRSRLRRAARVYAGGGADGLYIARDVSLLGGYLASGFNQTLLRTGALQKGPAKRFAETLQWALDVSAEDGMSRFGPGYRSTLRVRLIHALVRRHVAALPDWQAERWGLPINQTDMAATLVGALISPMVGSMAMGKLSTRAERADAAHLTRYVGWLIGVQEQFLPTGFTDSVRLLYHCLSAIMTPDDTTPLLARPMADEPLHWHYRNLPGVRGRIARSRHLSVATAFLGPAAMRRLGLPAFTPPWYPALRVPVNLARSAVDRLLPGGAERAAVRGRREQLDFLALLVGTDRAVIGDSARHIAA